VTIVKNIKDWNILRESSALDGLFYDLRFHTYHVGRRFNWRHLIIFKGSEPVAGMVGAVDKDRFISQPGASFGGILYRRNIASNNLINIVEMIINFLRSTGIREIEVRLPPIVYFNPESEIELLALSYNRFTLLRSTVTSIIDLKQEDLIGNLKSPTRR